jgi:hypothetical protein
MLPHFFFRAVLYWQLPKWCRQDEESSVLQRHLFSLKHYIFVNYRGGGVVAKLFLLTELPTAYRMTNRKNTTPNMTNMNHEIGLWWRFHWSLSLILHSLLMVEVWTRFWWRDKKLNRDDQNTKTLLGSNCLANRLFIVQLIRPTVYICHLFRA